MTVINMYHTVRSWFESSLRFRILSAIGIIISSLMILISLMILYQWRTLIIHEMDRNARSITKAFSIPVIDALIQAEQQETPGADHLETHIQSFLDNVPAIRYISIQDNQHRIIGHSDLQKYNQFINSKDLLAVIQSRETLSSIYEDPEHGWVLEVLQPLQIGQKRWGTAIVGFDASDTRKRVANIFFQLFFLTMMALIVTLSLLYFFIQRILASLRGLVEEVDHINLDTPDTGSLKRGKDEIGYVLNRFDHLKKRLQQSKKDLEKAQHQIFQAEKLASIGRLASGVAHEVNNPLNGMRFCVYSIQKDPDNQQQTREYLNLINEGLVQIESIVTKLLGYSRQRPKSTASVSLINNIKTVLELLDYRLKEKHITVEVQNHSSVNDIQADPYLLQEVMMNLLLNSLDAIDETGIIIITIDQPDACSISISVYDTGCGINSEDMELIFEPFFSTKETGKGTGLGLSVTHGIIESHGGSIYVNSEPGKFTKFVITLPISPENEHSNR